MAKAYYTPIEESRELKKLFGIYSFLNDRDRYLEIAQSKYDRMDDIQRAAVKTLIGNGWMVQMVIA